VRALIDGDIISYQSSGAAEKRWYLVSDEEGVIGEFKTQKDFRGWLRETGSTKSFEDFHLELQIQAEPVENVYLNVEVAHHRILTATNCDDFQIYLTPNRTFRHDLAVSREYKGKRPASRRPTHQRAAAEYLKEKFGARTPTYIEADDCLAIEAYKDLDHSVICSTDKDLLQVPCWHYNLTKRRLFFVGAPEASYNLHIQILMGDATDSIDGIPDVGPTTAKRLLANVKKDGYALAQKVRSIYRSHFGEVEGGERYTETRRLVELLTHWDQADAVTREFKT
jgi:hypothetical protein